MLRVVVGCKGRGGEDLLGSGVRGLTVCCSKVKLQGLQECLGRWRC